ncbi:peptidoglycan-binding domain-containing protein [Streptomyces sp. GC420]|uniref:peptidoglycan-binding domain-containing protein n=1 Tax=Streptomyces sp. GC420 TaxID=2697568 RepID=UPI001414EF68|nr:peptidoglycan-binding domain-containing protein [Streptomyces sp. GC420]NBM20662.1 hypothetical protein [Streptomyces sp. GC420]
MKTGYGPTLQRLITDYQQDVGLTVTGEADAATFASLHGGRVASQNSPGKVTADSFPPATVDLG